MAKRICFISTPSESPVFKETEVEFQYFNGFSVSQKQKSIDSMHTSIARRDATLRVLEISTKSSKPLGIALSAFKLKFLDEASGKEYSLENIFQSSKVFELGGPFRDLLNVHPREAKRDERLKSSGNLIAFNYNDIVWPKEPQTMFYDWIYISALLRNEKLSKEILDYNAFTDIEFNQMKSINCQARSAAIFVSLAKLGKLESVINDKEQLMNIYLRNRSISKQISMFDK